MVSTALATGAGTLAFCAGAMAGPPPGPANSAKRTSKAVWAAVTEPETAT
jgi:hypothetical protein